MGFCTTGARCTVASEVGVEDGTGAVSCQPGPMDMELIILPILFIA